MRGSEDACSVIDCHGNPCNVEGSGGDEGLPKGCSHLYRGAAAGLLAAEVCIGSLV